MVGKKVIMELIDMIEGGGDVKLLGDLNSIIEYAAVNKVLLHILRALRAKGALRYTQEKNMSKILNVVKTLSRVLEDYNYSFFKLIKPVAYVPADIDILVDAHQLKDVAKEIIKIGFRIVIRDPYCITLVNRDIIVDIYTYPSLGGVIFIDGQKLLEYAATMEFYGINIRSLERYVEALVTATHAIYKERIYTLNDFFTVRKWISRETFKLARDLKCKKAVELALKINKEISEGVVGAPYKVPSSLWLTLLTQKFKDDKLTKATMLMISRKLVDRRIGKLILSKIMRETY